MNDLFIHFSSFMCPHHFYQKHSYSPLSYNKASDDICNSIIPPIQQPVTHMTLPKLATIRHNIDNNPINLHWTKSSLTLFSFERPLYTYTSQYGREDDCNFHCMPNLSNYNKEGKCDQAACF